MGSGKSAVGRKLARALSLPFYDSDAEIERKSEANISLIFAKEGESCFRGRERDAIEALTAMEGIVLATGGGAVVLPENRRNLRMRGRVVYLETSVTQQASRVGQGKNRPMLTSEPDRLARLGQLMEARGPFYAEIADITVSTDGRHVYEVVDLVLAELAAIDSRGR
jgi:shikimate kinase